MEEMLAQVEDILHHEPYSKTEIVKLLDLSNEEELFQLCQVSDHVKVYETFELHKRATHVFGEAKRVYDFKKVCDDTALQTSGQGDSNCVQGSDALIKLGELMFASHESCAKMYDCSHPQLDTLVNLSKQHGALGARYNMFHSI